MYSAYTVHLSITAAHKMFYDIEIRRDLLLGPAGDIFNYHQDFLFFQASSSSFLDSIQSTSELFSIFSLLEFAHVQHMCNWLALSNMFDYKRITSVYIHTQGLPSHIFILPFFSNVKTSGSHNHLTLPSSALAGSYLFYFFFPSVNVRRKERNEREGGGQWREHLGHLSSIIWDEVRRGVARPNRHNKREMLTRRNNQCQVEE